MKRTLLIIYSTLLAITSFAQNISVASFKMLPNDLTANTNGTEVLDQNGDKAALIKVVTTQTGFTFEGGALGITKVKQESGEVWVYVPQKSKKITIKHSQLGVLRDYYFPCAIEAARTYEMRFIEGDRTTYNVNDDGRTYFTLTAAPKNAVVLIDNVLQPLDEDGSLIMRMNRGDHTYSVQAAGHIAENGVFTLGVDKLNKSITLKSTMAELAISCETNGVEIFVNETKKGNNKWNGKLVPGDYLIEARKDGYVSRSQSITLGDCEKKTLVMPGLVARVGSLDVNYKPIGCKVKIDGREVGASPDVFKSIMVGKHTVELYKEGYFTISKDIKIEEGQTCTITGSMSKGWNFSDDGKVSQLKGELSANSILPQNTVYEVVDPMPSYPGGINALMHFLSTNIHYPEEAEKYGVEGRVICTFVIEKDGSISDVRIAKSVYPLLDAEAMRVISIMPLWEPGKLKGIPVRVKYTLPVTFRLQ